jgi:hypothetical protein
MKTLNESNIPKKVFKPDLEIDLIEKCLEFYTKSSTLPPKQK